MRRAGRGSAGGTVRPDGPGTFSRSGAGSKGPEAGFTFLEVVFTLAILAIALLGAMGGMFFSLRLNAANDETASAVRMGRAVVERLRSVPFDTVYREFNCDPLDDPAGVGTARGCSFKAADLLSRSGDDLDMEAQVRFPEESKGVIRENQHLPELGLPADLNGDGAINAANRTNDYIVMPVLVQVRWNGRDGERTIEFFTILRE